MTPPLFCKCKISVLYHRTELYLFSQFLTILQRRSMEMFSDILAKERSVGETENTRNLLYRLARRSQIISNIRKSVLSYPVDGSLAGMALAHDGQIFWGDAQLLGKILYRLMLDLALLQQFEELVEKVACRGRSGFSSFSMVEEKLLHNANKALLSKVSTISRR